MRRFLSGLDPKNPKNMVSIEVPVTSSQQDAKSSIDQNRVLACFGILLAAAFSGVGLMALLSGGNPSARIARDVILNNDNDSLRINCPPDRFWINASAIVAACQFVSDQCQNTSFINSTFTFLLNVTNVLFNNTNETVLLNFLGHCTDTEAQNPDYAMGAFFFVAVAVCAAGTLAYLQRAKNKAAGIDPVDSTTHGYWPCWPRGYWPLAERPQEGVSIERPTLATPVPREIG